MVRGANCAEIPGANIARMILNPALTMNEIQLYNFNESKGNSPFWIKDYGLQTSRSVLLNLPFSARSAGDSYFHPTHVYIDASIAHIIQALNDKGYITSNCCSGLDEDHTEGGCGGYIAFLDKCPLSLEGARLDRDRTVFRQPIGATNEEKKKLWEAVYLQVLELPPK